MKIEKKKATIIILRLIISFIPKILMRKIIMFQRRLKETAKTMNMLEKRNTVFLKQWKALQSP